MKSKELNKTHQAYQYKKTFPLGPWTTYSYLTDPIHLSFVLSRYKFVSRMFSGKKDILEVGCGDAIGTPIVAQFCRRLSAIDIDQKIILSNKKRMGAFKNIEFSTMDFRTTIPRRTYDAVFSIDVIEHIEPEFTEEFMRNTCKCLPAYGVTIIGTPNITSGAYASSQSNAYHVNLHSEESLRDLLSRFFHNVFLFSMNDEVVHTGFFPMAHYLWGIGIGKKS